MFKVIDNTDCVVLEMFDDYDCAMNYALNFSYAHPSHSLEVKKVGSILSDFVMDGFIY